MAAGTQNQASTVDNTYSDAALEMPTIDVQDLEIYM